MVQIKGGIKNLSKTNGRCGAVLLLTIALSINANADDTSVVGSTAPLQPSVQEAVVTSTDIQASQTECDAKVFSLVKIPCAGKAIGSANFTSVSGKFRGDNFSSDRDSQRIGIIGAFGLQDNSAVNVSGGYYLKSVETDSDQDRYEWKGATDPSVEYKRAFVVNSDLVTMAVPYISFSPDVVGARSASKGTPGKFGKGGNTITVGAEAFREIDKTTFGVGAGYTLKGDRQVERSNTTATYEGGNEIALSALVDYKIKDDLRSTIGYVRNETASAKRTDVRRTIEPSASDLFHVSISKYVAPSGMSIYGQVSIEDQAQTVLVGKNDDFDGTDKDRVTRLGFGLNQSF